ncbi:MAG: hypothetical protein DHS20C18_08350 [Saprospiraceae bacterium]|nr:MAG: hypothetical protein DHS20C18_08350 [Saprospiraceae bacterium]
MIRLKKLLLTALLLSTIGYLHAQYNGPHSTDNIYTVKEVIDNASKLDKTDTLVKLKGYIIEQLNKDSFWFKDESGKILVEIDKKDLSSVAFDENTEVTIIGEVDYDLLEEIEIEVEQLFLSNP